jgi:hypothetical protein
VVFARNDERQAPYAAIASSFELARQAHLTTMPELRAVLPRWQDPGTHAGRFRTVRYPLLERLQRHRADAFG